MIPGTGGRWALGVVILTHLIAYNETGGVGALIAVLISAIYSIFSGICKSNVRNLQISYIRTTNKFDFLCLFMGKWLEILALFSACAILVRTLSFCLDEMTGQMVKTYILGRDYSANEPWPDVIGVAVIFVVSLMFMLGLENTKIFSCMLVIGVGIITVFIGVLSNLKGNFSSYKTEELMPKGTLGLISGAAITAFSYPNEMPSRNHYARLMGFVMIIAVLISNILAGCGLATLIHFDSTIDYQAVPLIQIMDQKDFQKGIRAISCLFVLTCSCAILELFPEMITQIVELTKSDWKLLPRPIGYENRDSGSPALAIFTGGSLCAMLAFACPMQHLTFTLAASHLLSGMLKTFYLTYYPFRPKYVEHQNESSLSYSRLNQAPSTSNATNSGSNKAKKTIWFFKRPSMSHPTLPKSRAKLNKKGNREEMEREWLLLGEPPSPSPHVSTPQDAESSILSDQISDIDCLQAKPENSDSDDSSTDIDAIVDEYRQKIKVTNAGPLDNKTLRIPSAASWRFAVILFFLVLTGCVMATVGILREESTVIIIGVNVTFIMAAILMLLPRYDQQPYSPPSVMICTISILGATILFSATISLSWPALVLWILAGLFLFLRCDTWCCLCLDRPHSQLLITMPSSLAANSATIRVPRPPKGAIIQTRINGHVR